MFNNVFPNIALFTRWKTVVAPDRPQMTI